MKTTAGNSTTVSGASGVMPPRWGLKLFGGVVFYKHGAPLALDGDGRLSSPKAPEERPVYGNAQPTNPPSSVGAA